MLDIPLPFDFSLPNILILVAVVMNTFLGVLIFAKRRAEYENQVYVLNIILIVWWSVAMLIYRSDTTWLLGSTIMLYLVPTFIASSFLYFSLIFPNLPIKGHHRYIFPILGINAMVGALVLAPGSVISGISIPPMGENIVAFGPYYPIYAAYISTFFAIGLGILAYKYFTTKDGLKRRQIIYLLVGYSTASTLAMVTNLTLPYFGFYELNWLGQVLTVFMVLPVTYAIFRHRLFDVKVIATEILVALLWLFLLIRAFFSSGPQEATANIAILLITLVIGVLLIRSVDREVEQRERLEKLTTGLEKANMRLRELDKQKSEFIGIAAHQLRTPIAVVKGYSSLMLEGSYGKITKKLHDVLKTIYDSSDRMADTIDDFLNVTRIEQGRMEYHKERMDLHEAIERAIASFGLSIGEKGLTVSFEADACKREDHALMADPAKIKHVLNNLLDNAIKYTSEGSITVTLACDRKKGVVRIGIRDTGAGIPQQSMAGLFEKFVRAPNAKKVNVNGSGLGLFVARQMIEAHGGRIWAESDGEGKGSTFSFELPLEESPVSGSIGA